MDQPLHIMSLKQAALYLGISEPTLKRRIQSKQNKAYKDGGYWKIKREWAEEYQNNLLKQIG
ncbi:excisionase family DNA-binding protein [Cryptosporangium minutisporangium]|uniref:excisionase family DNA-binding protein n=1 Tax=Cryptosporangium minutisporangium TaxID=113569 RepID=UPI0035EF4669